MDTIAINTGEAINEDGRDKKKVKLNDTTKAAMATGAAGLGAGVAAKSIVDALEENSENEVSTITDGHAQSEETVPEIEPTEDVVAEVNPDEVMLEESTDELSTGTDMLAEVASQSSEEDPYRPFASNDNIEEDALQEPQPDEDLIAENTEVDVIAGDDPSVDVICGLPDIGLGPEIIEEQILTESELYADNGSDFDDSDIQSDLMA